MTENLLSPKMAHWNREPLDPEGFADALFKGLGRTLFEVQRLGRLPAPDLIFAHCCEDRSYDRQCEVDRPAWMVEILQAGGVLCSMGSDLIAWWAAQPGTAELAFGAELLFHLAARGVPGVEEALWEMFRRDRGSDAEPVGVGEILRLQGRSAVVPLADHLGSTMESEDFWVTGDVLLTAAEGLMDREEIEECLRDAAPTRPGVARFVEFWHSSEATRDHRRTQKQRSGARGSRRRRGPQEPDAEAILAEILATTDERRKGALLVALSRAVSLGQRPSNIEPLLVLARDACNQNDKGRGVFWRSRRVLGMISDMRVRELFDEEAARAPDSPATWILATRNSLPGDLAKLTAAVERVAAKGEKDDLHQLGSEAIKIVGRGASEEAISLLELIYEATPCSICRHDALVPLLNVGVNWSGLAHEGPLDVNLEIRSLFTKGTQSCP